MIYKLNSQISLQGNIGHNILENRGIKNVEEYLNPMVEVEYDPLLLDNIVLAATTLHDHLQKGSNIFIQIDSDADGYCSAAIIYQYIKDIKPNANINWRVHEGKQHGIIIETIPENTGLAIITDAGSNQLKEHNFLREQGIDFIVLDHHMAEGVNEEDIIVNNQLSENYPNKSLCGAGIVYKFCEVYDRLYTFNFSHKYIDLVAIALVGDMMDLKNIETRYLTKTGLEKKDKNPFIQAAIKSRSFSIGDIENIKPVDVSFYIAPLINALVRVGKQSEKEILFKGMVEGNKTVPSLKRGAGINDTEILCEQAVRICSNAHSRQAKAKEKALDSLDVKINKNSLMDDQIIFVPIEEDEDVFDTSLTGLIAMQITAKYAKPTIVARQDNKGVWRGSARASSRTIGDLRQFFLDSGFFLMAEGHPLAHGIAIEDKNIEPFIEYANKELSTMNFHENTYLVDFIINANDEHFSKIIMEIGALNSIWGQGVEEPLIVIENLRVPIEDIQIIGKTQDTVKISVGEVNLIKFKDSKLAGEITKYSFVDLTIVGRANLNNWCGTVTPQIFILDYIIKGNNFDF